MIITESQNIGICNVCYGAATNLETLELANCDIRRFAYVFAGDGTVKMEGTGRIENVSQDTFLDMREETTCKHHAILFHTSFGMWGGFNVSGPSEQLDATLLNAGTYDLIKTEDMETLFVTKGGIVANGKSIPVRGFAHLPDGREIRVEIPEGSLAIHLKKPAIPSDTPL